MVADVLREAIQLIKAGKKVEAQKILEPFIVANPQNIQAWVWEIETADNNAEKIKLMEACLLHNPDAGIIKKALAALKTQQVTPVSQKTPEGSPFTIDTFSPETQIEEGSTPQVTLAEEVVAPQEILVEELNPAVKTQEPAREVACLHCGKMIPEGAAVCKSCGRNQTVTEVEAEEKTEKVQKAAPRKKWYRMTWVKVLTFIFLMPIWTLIELGDPDAKKGTKILAGFLLTLFIALIGFFIYWIFASDAAKLNLVNWYQYISGQSEAIPGEIIRVNGRVVDPGTSSFSLIELEARVYDEDGNLMGTDTRYIDSSSISTGTPYRFQLDVTSLLSSLNGGLATQQVLLYDSFSDTASGWTNFSSEEGEAIYYEGQYRLKVNNSNYDLWSNRGVDFSDIKIEVDATKLAGPESNRFGVQCRYVDVDNYYFAIISSDGYYGIGKVIDGAQTFLRDSGMLITDKVNMGSALNHIRFDCVGTRLSLYLNGDYVDAVDDSALSSGDVGLLAGTFEKKGTQISFDNFVVINP